jgi:hypothetical protein
VKWGKNRTFVKRKIYRENFFCKKSANFTKGEKMEKLKVTKGDLNIIAPIICSYLKEERDHIDHFDKYFSFNDLDMKNFYSTDKKLPNYTREFLEEDFPFKLFCLAYLAASYLDSQYQDIAKFQMFYARLANKCERCNRTLISAVLDIIEVEMDIIPSEHRVKLYREWELRKVEPIIEKHSKAINYCSDYESYDDMFNHSLEIVRATISELEENECPNYPNENTMAICLVYSMMRIPIGITMYRGYDGEMYTISDVDNVRIHQKAIFNIIKNNSNSSGFIAPGGLTEELKSSDFNAKKFADDIYPDKTGGLTGMVNTIFMSMLDGYKDDDNDLPDLPPQDGPISPWEV